MNIIEATWWQLEALAHPIECELIEQDIRCYGGVWFRVTESGHQRVDPDEIFQPPPPRTWFDEATNFPPGAFEQFMESHVFNAQRSGKTYRLAREIPAKLDTTEIPRKGANVHPICHHRPMQQTPRSPRSRR